MAEERKYRIRVDGILVDVSKEVYHAYYSIERHTRTLDEKDTRNGKVLYSDLDTDELLGEEMLPDRNAERVEDSAICSILCEELHYQLAMLPAQDIIQLPHPTSARHPRMSLSNRAAQFSPFAALSGHSAALAETARLTDQRVEWDEGIKERLDLRFQLLIRSLRDQPVVSLICFLPDTRKAGGSVQ